MSLLSVLTFVSRHPLNQGGRARAWGRVLRWQIASRLGPGAVAVPFIDNTRLLVTPGMTGATGNWYCGLHEANDMGFVLHYLRSSDTFWDVGANIGSYTILAAGAAGARAVAIEPIPTTFTTLRANIRLNDLDDKVLLINAGLAAKPGALQFTSDLDTMNHALVPGEANACEISVNVTTLDALALKTSATFIKIDVEGLESAVLEGGRTCLRSDSLRCVVMEINGSGQRFGVADAEIHGQMRDFGFVPAAYDVLARCVVPLPIDSWNRRTGNTLYVRDIRECQIRAQSARSFHLVNRDV